MGLVFPLQPVRRKSTKTSLLLKTTSKKFTVGSTLIFIALILFSMYLAAGPLFNTMLEQGAWIDKCLAYGFYGVIYLFPVVALFCWFYQETLLIEKEPTGFHLYYSRAIGPARLQKTDFHIPDLQSLAVANWVGSRNMAAIAPDPNAPEQRRYATRGHWMLNAPVGDLVVTVERRAKKEDIEWLKAVILSYFAV